MFSPLQWDSALFEVFLINASAICLANKNTENQRRFSIYFFPPLSTMSIAESLPAGEKKTVSMGWM